MIKQLLCILSSAYVFASTIPEYEIQSKVNKILTLTNGAQFEATNIGVSEYSTWQPGDMVQLANSSTESNCRISSNQMICPGVYLDNITRNHRANMIYNKNSSLNSDGVFTITDVDTRDRNITLDDGSIWHYDSNSRDLDKWVVGQHVMIGRKMGLVITYDAMLFNTDAPNTIFVREVN